MKITKTEDDFQIVFNHSAVLPDEKCVLLHFYGTQSIVTIPEGVTSIESKALENRGLIHKELMFPTTLRTVHNQAIYHFPVEKIVFLPTPDGVTFHGNTFVDCHNLTTVIFDDMTDDIGLYTFQNCPKLDTVKLPANLKRVHTGTFTYCNGLRQIVFPAAVEDIQEGVFNDCENIETIILPRNVRTISKDMILGSHPKCTIVCPTNQVLSLANKVFPDLNVISLYDSDLLDDNEQDY